MADNAQGIKVRQVTDIHANWSEQGDGEPGKFSLQFVLDNGAEEYVIRPVAQDTKVLIKLIQSSESLYFDTERQVLIPSALK
ncbi:hypothetical protein GBA63_01525 [Rubrobacter tropicus]|uniref:Uncharacterized protein n=1 Tax=Rubrobacter tropicus TaxID=2653851 RepID=A0A6G8Q4Q4_9ACTN|nr:hypothetical protein [Rubrobacter tropicus]QIN81451.1 hypothetical protein GBA63_01525 [Rubrobacter tropicus]